MTILLEEWSVTPATNGFPVPDGAEVGWKGADVNEWGREVMTVVRTWYDDPEWLSITRDLTVRGPKTVSKIDASSFRVEDCDATAYFTVGRRVRMRPGGGPPYVESHVLSVNYSASDTIVTIIGTNVPLTFVDDGADVYFAKSIDPGAFAPQPAVGDLKMTATLQSAAAINGWLQCDGDEYLVASYPALAAAMGATGAGDGYYDEHPSLGAPTNNYFRVPDFAGRVPVGFWDAAHPDDEEPDGDYNFITGDNNDTWVGEKKHVLTEDEGPQHNHGGATGGDGAHDHTVRTHNTGGGDPTTLKEGANDSPSSTQSAPIGTEGNHTHTISNSGLGDGHENRQASIVSGYLIYSGVL